ncbi:hypothetical protein ACNKHN_00915 [Shigella flexneri]
MQKVLDAAVAGKITDVEVLKAQFEEERVALVAKIGENINIRRVACAGKATFWVLISTVRVSVFWLLLKALTELVKHIAMHVAATSEQSSNAEDVSA